MIYGARTAVLIRKFLLTVYNFTTYNFSKGLLVMVLGVGGADKPLRVCS